MPKNSFVLGEAGLALIKKFEGFRSKPYLDAIGKPTIGYGSTRVLDGSPVSLKTPAVTESQAVDLLKVYAKQFGTVVNANVKVELNQNQFDALVSFVYNVGTGNFLSSTLLRLLNQGKYDAVPAQFLRWNKADGKELAGLTTRRKAEADLFQS